MASGYTISERHNDVAYTDLIMLFVGSVEKLQLPSSSSFFVYVCYVKSPTNIAIRVIDEDYSVRTLSISSLTPFPNVAILRLFHCAVFLLISEIIVY